MPRKFMLRAVLPIGAALAAATAGLPAASAMPPAVGGSVQVKVPVQIVQAPLSSALNGLVRVQVGDSKPITVILDTGSVGLRLFKNAWQTPPAGVVVSKSSSSVSVRGVTFSGTTGSGSFEIGGVPSAYPITFQVVTGNNPYIKAAVKKGIQGILGVGMSRQSLPNPLASLPGNVGRHWSIAYHADKSGKSGAGMLMLGAAVPANAVANVSPPFQGTGAFNQALWNDQKAPMCWTVGVTVDTCVSTYFDSVLPYVLATGPAFANLPANSQGYLRPGRSVAARASGAAYSYWNFTSGTTLSNDVVKVSGNGKGLVNMGNAAYFDYTVTYDLQRGLVSFS